MKVNVINACSQRSAPLVELQARWLPKENLIGMKAPLNKVEVCHEEGWLMKNGVLRGEVFFSYTAASEERGRLLEELVLVAVSQLDARAGCLYATSVTNLSLSIGGLSHYVAYASR